MPAGPSALLRLLLLLMAGRHRPAAAAAAAAALSSDNYCTHGTRILRPPAAGVRLGPAHARPAGGATMRLRRRRRRWREQASLTAGAVRGYFRSVDSPEARRSQLYCAGAASERGERREGDARAGPTGRQRQTMRRHATHTERPAEGAAARDVRGWPPAGATQPAAHLHRRPSMLSESGAIAAPLSQAAPRRAAAN